MVSPKPIRARPTNCMARRRRLRVAAVSASSVAEITQPIGAFSASGSASPSPARMRFGFT
jgi:hypothetical protein